MDHLPLLLKKCCPDSKIASHVACGRTTATKLIKTELSIKAKNNLFGILRKCYFSIIADETTYVSTSKALALVARFHDTKLGKTCDKFFGLLELQKCDANSIFVGIKNYLEKCSIPMQNVIGLATDNASVMAGDISGLRSRFRDLNPHLFYIRCTCHSLHLCASIACKNIPKEIEKLTRDIYNFFAHSSKRITELKEFQEYVGVKKHFRYSMAIIKRSG